MVAGGNRMSRLMVEECFKWASARKVFGKRLVGEQRAAAQLDGLERRRAARDGGGDGGVVEEAQPREGERVQAAELAERRDRLGGQLRTVLELQHLEAAAVRADRLDGRRAEL